MRVALTKRMCMTPARVISPPLPLAKQAAAAYVIRGRQATFTLPPLTLPSPRGGEGCAGLASEASLAGAGRGGRESRRGTRGELMAAASYASLQDRGVLEIAGIDRKAFLQGLVSNDVQKLGP